jgi:CheY-like chemotaxis protein
LDDVSIFSVDDDPEIRKFFKETSASLGIRCDVAASGEEAAEMLARDNNYNIFFIDWKLPGINGIELAGRLRAEAARKPVVILFSSTDWSSIRDEAHAAGIDKFLPKPLFRSSVVDVINECVGIAPQDERGKKDSGGTDDFSGYTILLAEDIEINREILTAMLEETRLKIDCAENGVIAVGKFCEAPDKYDMIFMDIQMPEMDGYEATRRIRAADVPRAKEVPIVAMTANVFKEDIEQCIASGMNSHIGKPLDNDEVLKSLRTHLPAKSVNGNGRQSPE